MEQLQNLKAAGGRRRATRKIAVSLLKGGVSKSITAINLGHGLALAGCKVLLVDTDIQSHCNDTLGLKPSKGLADVIAGWADPLGTIVRPSWAIGPQN